MIYLIITLIIVVLDQISKTCVSHFIKIGQQKNLIKGILSFTYVENRGAAFGILQGARVFFLLITVIVLFAALFYIVKARPQSKLEKTALAFIAGGAVGNFIDRAFLSYVRDFISADFINFPVFNIADCFVCIGAALYILHILCEERSNEKNTTDSAQ